MLYRTKVLFSNSRYGYGLEYQYEPNGSYERQRGYGFVKAYGRDFCKETDKSKCLTNQANEEHRTTNDVHDGVLNLNHFNEPITNSANSVNSASSANRLATSSDQTPAKDNDFNDELKNDKNPQLTTHQQIVQLYHRNKNAHLPDSVHFDGDAPAVDKVNFHQNKMLIFDDINSLSSADSRSSNPSSLNYVSHVNHRSTNQPIDRPPNESGVIHVNSKQNSQLIDTSNRLGDKQSIIHLASNHYTHFDDDTGEHDEHHYHTDHYDPFAEQLSVPKIVHSAAKQLHHKSTDHYSSYDSDADYSRSTNYKNDYDDTFDSHILGATRLRPKFIKVLVSKQATTEHAVVTTERPVERSNEKKDENLNKNSLMNSSSESKAANLAAMQTGVQTHTNNQNSTGERPQSDSKKQANVYSNELSKNKREKRTIIDWLRP